MTFTKKECSLTYKDFVELCRQADNLIIDAKQRDKQLTGYSPTTLKAAAVFLLGDEKGIGYHDLSMIFPCSHASIVNDRRRLRELLKEET